MIALDIWSDPICPWCHIGKAALDRALESRPGHPFAIAWHPFQLNPDMPPEGMGRQAYLALKFGDAQGIMNAYRPVIERAEAEGLALNLPAITRTPNTRDAHRLIHWAGIEGRQTAMVATLFRACFRDGLDIGDRDTLADLAANVGMERALAARMLASEADTDTIIRADRDARAHGITGVPFFVIGGEHAISGAQTTAFWQQIIDALSAQAPG
ncbi:MAG: DsbA family oxidoreductase [Rhodobacteraceae bacterium]|nr:DsbA family oxidoreductase [Paracoccaceae bacterium]